MLINKCKYVLVALILCSSFLSETSAHVALTYPPARKYDLDFLDNTRTKGPCGMPKGEWLKFIHYCLIQFCSLLIM